MAAMNADKDSSDSSDLVGFHNLDVLEFDDNSSVVRCLLPWDTSKTATMMLMDAGQEPRKAVMTQAPKMLFAAQAAEPIRVAPPPRLRGIAWVAAARAAAACAKVAFIPHGLAPAKVMESAAGFHFSLKIQTG